MRKPRRQASVTILLVEDEEMISEIAAEVLIEQGFEVLVVSNAGDALRLIASGAPLDACSPISICPAPWMASCWRSSRVNGGPTFRWSTHPAIRPRSRG